MLERLVASMDAWSKAAKQKPKPPQSMNRPPAHVPVGPGVRPLPPPPAMHVDPINPSGLRPGDLGTGIPIPRMTPPTLPPAGPVTMPPVHRGTVGPQPTMNTNPPPLRVTPFPATGNPGQGGAIPGDPQHGVGDTQSQLDQKQREIDDLRRRIQELRAGKAKTTRAGSPSDRGEPNDQGTYPYYRGHGPTKKFAHEQFQRYDAEMRTQHPEWYSGTRVKPVPAGFPGWDWQEFVDAGGEPAMTPAEQQRLRQQQREGPQFQPRQTGTPRRAPQGRGVNPPAGYRQPPPNGPFSANDRARRQMEQFQRRNPVLGPAGTPQIGPGTGGGAFGANQRAWQQMQQFQRQHPVLPGGAGVTVPPVPGVANPPPAQAAPKKPPARRRSSHKAVDADTLAAVRVSLAALMPRGYGR